MQGGPPFAVNVELYKSLLEPLGFVAEEIRPATDSFEQVCICFKSC